MKYVPWSVAGFCLLLAGYLAVDNHRVFTDNQRLKTLTDAQQIRSDILKDQLQEYEFNITNMKTYDEGYQAAIAKASTGTYSEGYTEGYHTAVNQFNGDSSEKGILKKIYGTKNE